MNKLITIVGAVVLLVIFAFYMCSFQVRFTEIAVLKTFGEFDKDDIFAGDQDAGLQGKWPWPIQSVVITDNRVRVMEDTYEETQTSDSQNVMVTSYVCWKIDENDPYKFHIASSSERDAESKLRSVVQAQKKIVVAQYSLSNFVSTDDEEFKFDDIEKALLTHTAAIAKEQYGIDVMDVGIRRLSFPKGVSEQVFDAMKKNEEKKAATFRSEGDAQAQEIRARASAISDNIMAVAERLADGIEAEANREVGEYYKEFDKNKALRQFLDQMEASKEVLRERTTLVLDSVIAPFGLIDLEHLDIMFEKLAPIGQTLPQTRTHDAEVADNAPSE